MGRGLLPRRPLEWIRAHHHDISVVCCFSAVVLRKATLRQNRDQYGCTYTTTARRNTNATTTVLVLSGLLPEPNASAAGVRTHFLLKQLAQTPGVDAVHFGTGAKINKKNENNSNSQSSSSSSSSSSFSMQELERLGVQFHQVPPNDSERMRRFLQDIGVVVDKGSIDDNNSHNGNPGHITSSNNKVLCILDRWYSEEAYSFHLHQHVPRAKLVLDMQDFHALRGHRQAWIQQRDDDPQQQQLIQQHTTRSWDPLAQLPMGLQIPPVGHHMQKNDKLLRELASIHRCHLTLVCSPVERQALQQYYQVPASKLCLASFFVDEEEHDSTVPGNNNNSSSSSSSSSSTPFAQRHDFVFIGGYRHEPNVDAVRQLHRLWPRIRAALPDARLHIYGPYAKPQLRQTHNPKQGFLWHGYQPDVPVGQLLSERRVLLAPLRFGAGLKGKIVDAWQWGTPVVTTPIGSEGLLGKKELEEQNHGSSSSSSSSSSNHNNSNNNHPSMLVAHNSNDFVRAAVELHENANLWHGVQQRAFQSLSDQFGHHHWNAVSERLFQLVSTNDNHGAKSHDDDDYNDDYLRHILWQQQLRSTEYFSKWIEEKNDKKRGHDNDSNDN